MRTDNRPNLTDEQIQSAAKAQGLYASVDKFGGHYLKLIDPPKKDPSAGMMSIDPHQVLYGVTRAELVNYLSEKHEAHKTLAPREFIAAIRQGVGQCS
jgi:hypothetical protein